MPNSGKPELGGERGRTCAAGTVRSHLTARQPEVLFAGFASPLGFAAALGFAGFAAAGLPAVFASDLASPLTSPLASFGSEVAASFLAPRDFLPCRTVWHGKKS